MGAVDIHFHGAFGIDLMSASPRQLHELSQLLAERGIAAFCATTLSVPFAELRATTRNLGAWISQGTPKGALPLGIHLEGPYIDPAACGAHPPEAIRPLKFEELDQLWEDSRHTLKLITFAPERLTQTQLARLVKWARVRKITLSLGHSKATEAQAQQAFDAGVQGLTHAWNALSFHHRAPGAMGAALGRKDVTMELILDQVHVAPSVMRWTREVHPRLCYVSDCVPAAATKAGTWHSFGDLKVRFKDGACRLKGDHLAGGGILLPEAFARWVEAEAHAQKRPAGTILREQLPSLTTIPLAYLGLDHLAKKLTRLNPVVWEAGTKVSFKKAY
jgi:N-acetylglucosamine-6-phosphate deacetylase